MKQQAAPFEKDSYISTASAVRGGDVPVTMEIIFTPEDSSEAITVNITGSAAYKDLSGFTADTYTATAGNETKEFDSTPSVFIAKNSNTEILEMINAYINNGTVSTGFTIDEETSFINGNNPSWIVFTNPAIDSAAHKVNFTPVNETVSNFSLDDCLDISEGKEIAISETPAYKPETLSIEEQKALEIGFEYLGYIYSKYDWPQNGTSTSTYDSFFNPAKDITVSHESNDDGSLATIEITAGNDKIHFITASSSGSLPEGYCTEFTVNGENYSYLRDELYNRILAFFCVKEILPSLQMIVMNPEESIPHDGNTYTFNDFNWKETILDGTAVLPIKESPAFSIDITVTEESSAPIRIICKGECGYEGEGNDMRAVFTCSEVDLPTNGGKASAFELDLINRCLYAITHQG